jgi:hypothetical protein
MTRTFASIGTTKRLWEAAEPAAIRDQRALGPVGWKGFLSTAITHESMAPCSAPSMLVAALRRLTRPSGIDGASARRARGWYAMAVYLDRHSGSSPVK